MPEELRRFENEDLVDWAVRSGRFAASRAPFWRKQLADERRRIIASGGPPAPSEVEATIQGLHPVLAGRDAHGEPIAASGVWTTGPDGHPVLASGAAAPTLSRTEELERALYGPSQVQRYAEEDARAEAELIELEEQDRIAASQGGLTPEEMRVLFGDDGKG